MSAFFVTQRFAPLLGLSLCLLLCGLPPLADANAFLGSHQPKDGKAPLDAAHEHVLLDELEAALGSGHRHATEKRLKRIEQRLSPMFGAMIKNENGRLGSSAGGYMLHRLFVQRHGWLIRALEPAGNGQAAWNTSTPTAVLEERVPAHVVDLFEKRLGTHGLDVRELAVLAASLEHLVHNEALQRLKAAYLAKGMSQEDVLSEEEAVHLLDMYMAIYIHGFAHNNLTTLTSDVAQSMLDNILEVYPSWPETQQFLRETYKSVAPKRDYVYFNEIENVIAEVGERYGRFQDNECRQMKDWLVAAEDPSVGGAGRIRISDFYKQALNEGHWQFSEAAEYLRQLGALDDSDPTNPRVIIPNYIQSPSNCVASSAYYSVCCIDECEGILSRLEEMISEPEATPGMITSLVEIIPSATIPSNRTLSPWLHQRLNEVAEHHGGRVPLHGRLFQQWLHYAYPRECPFPHVSGTINPKRGTEMMEQENITADVISLSATDMKRVVAGAAPIRRRVPGTEAKAFEESAMWIMHEELAVGRQIRQPQLFERFGYAQGLAMLAAAVSLSVAGARSLQPMMQQSKALSKSNSKFYV
jgi:hypothetical protein